MLTTLVASSKGGCGKSTLVTQLPSDTAQLLIDTAAGSRERDLEPYLEQASVLLVPVLPSSFDLDATLAFTDELRSINRVRRGKLPVALVANRLKPWTHASQDAIGQLAEQSPFPVVAQLRDSQAYVLLAALGKGIFDYHSEQVRSHQEDWKPLLRWIKRQS